jgi:hypothetical protein
MIGDPASGSPGLMSLRMPLYQLLLVQMSDIPDKRVLEIWVGLCKIRGNFLLGYSIFSNRITDCLYELNLIENFLGTKHLERKILRNN